VGVLYNVEKRMAMINLGNGKRTWY